MNLFLFQALLQFVCGTKIIITGDPIVPGITSLLVMNHRTRTDWNFLWSAIYHATCDGTKTGDRTGHDFRMKHPLKFVLKDSIRHIPGPGKGIKQEETIILMFV